MKILAISQYGWPEPHPALNPMEEMVKRGHSVDAITGIPNYPMGEIFDGYKHNEKKEEWHNGIHYRRVAIIPRKQDSIHRLLNYHSYPITAKWAVRKLDGDYDVVFVNQASPVMMAEPAIHYARKWNKRVVLYCMDLWPASLSAGGIKRNSPLYKFYWRLSKKVYKSVDIILVSSRLFKNYLTSEFSIPTEKIEYLPQYAPLSFDVMNTLANNKKNTIDFVFAGNVGTAQNLDVVIRAAKILETKNSSDYDKKICFHIVGDGQQIHQLQGYVKDNNIKSVLFHGRKPLDEMPYYYAMADAMLVTMTPDPLISLTLPAKVQSYMAAGKPVIACADGEISNVISESGCGFCAKADDEYDLVDKIKEFIASPEKSQFGIRAKEYYEKNFSKDIVMEKLECILSQ